MTMEAVRAVARNGRATSGRAERAWYRACLTLGSLLRSARYSTTRVVAGKGVRLIRKRRRWYAPALVWLSGPLMRILDTGVRVLDQRAWERRERDMYGRYLAASIGIEAGGTLVLPHLPGRTLADLLEDRTLEVSARRRAIALAVAALAAFHRLGLTHGDAMAENVLVDLDAGRAVWFDFETVHDPGRSLTWCRADDLRALLTTCLVRTSPAESAGTLALVLETYSDDEVSDALAANVHGVWRRSLAFHLAQAPLPFQRFRDVAALLRERIDEAGH
jgi:hypothetical protein